MAARRASSCIGSIISLVVVVVILGLLGVYSGIYNVSASYPDKAPVAWLLDNTMTYSVRHHARGIEVPDLNDPATIKKGYDLYRDTCIGCHGAPGVPIEKVIEKGMNPSPPELTESVKDWKPNELFWLTKNGVRMTGMPAWGVAHSDEEIWSIVAYLQKMPNQTADEYKAMGRQVQTK